MQPDASARETLLRLSGVRKTFFGVDALKGVDFDLVAGEVHALVGENGAGKSTLIKVITGAHEPDAGTLELRGEPVRTFDPVLAKRLEDWRTVQSDMVAFEPKDD